MNDRRRPASGTNPAARSGTELAGTIDWMGLEARYACRRQFVERLAHVAVGTMPDVPAQLRSLADAGRTSEIAAVAHSLRTGTDVLMAYSARDLAAEVENA